MNDNLVDVQVDLSEDTILKLAMEAHKQNITLNDLCINILQDYIDGKFDEQITQESLISDLQKATKEMVTNGITVETLSTFGQAFTSWNMEYHGNTTYRKIIQDGFDDADKEMEPPF
jgi:hypothetical protein